MKDLTQWHEHLAKHFADLHASRCNASGRNPVFALEHGLDLADRQALEAAVRSHVARRRPSNEHELAWIVYAAEIGYGYSGDEYWQTFEESTQGWTEHGDRNWIRDCYRAFQRNYGGAVPTGVWASHFTIICWPITHAILPRDLQLQLAHILYDLRHAFTAELFESPYRLGEFIASRSWNATSRFQNLAQETHLIGQIAAALLLQGQFGTGNLIYPTTLRRIGEDLDRERRGREWLRRARHSAQERAQIRGLGFDRRVTGRRASGPEAPHADLAPLGIEPRLVLRRKDVAGLKWEAALEIPDLSHLIHRFPNTRGILMGSRCVVAGTSGRPLAAGRLLHGPQRVALVRWPRPDEVLVRFEQEDHQLEYILRSECLMRPGSIWLFRIASDGLAYESRSLRVRSGQRYIVLRPGGAVDNHGYALPIEVDCDGVDGAILHLPAAFTVEWKEEIRRLGLRQARSVEIWPAGLGALAWDGEGHGEWLESERPCLAICSDHAAKAIGVSLNHGTPLELMPTTAGEPIFIELPRLPVGLHTVRIRVLGDRVGQAEVPDDLDLNIRIREERAWSAGMRLHGPLRTNVNPVAPTLEQLWEGRAEIGVSGPSGRMVSVEVSLFERDSEDATLLTRLPNLSLPVTPSAWKSHFMRYFRETRDAQDLYDSARLCQIIFSAEELGAFTLRCDRELSPLRWSLRKLRRQGVLCLIDDSGASDAPALSRLSFETPTVREPLETLSDHRVAARGGLYMATRSNVTCAVIVPPMVQRIEDLSCSPHIEGGNHCVELVMEAIGIACQWRTARLSGGLMAFRNQNLVLRALTGHIMCEIGGERWREAERRVFIGADDSLGQLKRAVSHRPEKLGIAAALMLEVDQLSTSPLESRVARLAGLLRSFRVGSSQNLIDHITEDPQWLAELALRLASDPSALRPWAKGYGTLGVTCLMEEMPIIARAARFLVIATDRHLRSQPAPNELYAGWSWT